VTSSANPLAGERVVEVAELAVEHERVGELALERAHEVGVSAGQERVDRVFLVVGVEVAVDEKVVVAAAGGIAGQPVDERLGGGCAREVAVARAVSRVGLADVVAVRTLGHEVSASYSSLPVSGRLCPCPGLSNQRASRAFMTNQPELAGTSPASVCSSSASGTTV
jgi:hypothetical protein